MLPPMSKCLPTTHQQVEQSTPCILNKGNITSKVGTVGGHTALALGRGCHEKY